MRGNRAPTLLVHGSANVAYLNKFYFTFLCKISALRERVSAQGKGGGGTLSFSSYVNSGPSIYHSPKKISGISSTPKIFEILATQKIIPHSVP